MQYAGRSVSLTWSVLRIPQLLTVGLSSNASAREGIAAILCCATYYCWHVVGSSAVGNRLDDHHQSSFQTKQKRKEQGTLEALM